MNCLLKEVDIYSYSLTCYKILVGKCPFEGQSWTCDDVIKGQCLEIP